MALRFSGSAVDDAAIARDRAVDVLELHLEDLRVAQAELDEALRVLAARELVELRVVELAPRRGQRLTTIASRSRLPSVCSLPSSSGSARAYVSNADAVIAERVLVEARDAVEQLHLLERVGRVLRPALRGRE